MSEIREGLWSWNATEDGVWGNGTCETKKEALRDAFDCGERRDIYVGQVKWFRPTIDAETILEQLRCDAGEECGESSDGYLDSISHEAEAELTRKFQEVFDEWVKAHDQQPCFYTLENVHAVNLSEERVY